MSTRTLTYGPRRWRRWWPFSWFIASGYVRRLRWQVRLLGWLVTGGLAAIAGWPYAVLGPLAFEMLFAASLVADERRTRHLPGPVARDPDDPVVRAMRAEARRVAALPRVASPGGWTPPAGVRPAWNWTPPSGAQPRLNRAPLWARVWYGTPLVDRYAHAWLWHHGGYDVVPPEAWDSPLA